MPPRKTFVSPLTPDPDLLSSRVALSGSVFARLELDSLVAGRKIVLSVDRVEPSKNLLRSFSAYDEMLRAHPELRERVVMLSLAYLSRQGLPEYLAYGTEVQHAAERINDTWATDGWTPIVLDIEDNYERSLAALTRYDVLLVNPVRDGLNLVAKEGPIVNTKDGVLALSREAGAFEELKEQALELNPFDVASTAEVLAGALTMAPEERSRRAAALRSLATRRPPGDWLEDQLEAARV